MYIYLFLRYTVYFIIGCTYVFQDWNKWFSFQAWCQIYQWKRCKSRRTRRRTYGNGSFRRYVVVLCVKNIVCCLCCLLFNISHLPKLLLVTQLSFFLPIFIRNCFDCLPWIFLVWKWFRKLKAMEGTLGLMQRRILKVKAT